MSDAKYHHILFFILMGAVLLLFFYLMKPLLFPIFWAAVIASIFRPPFRWLHGKIQKPSLISAILLLMIIVIIFLPAAIIASLLIGESIEIYNSIDTDSNRLEESVRNLINRFSHHPLLAKLHVNEAFVVEKFSEVAKDLTGYIVSSLTDLTQNTMALLLKFAVMLYTLFFFLRDGDRFLAEAIRFFALGKGRETVLYKRFTVTALATLKVTLIIGGIQGLIGGILFFATGIKGALTWGVIMVFASIIPGVGCSIIWVPASIMMFISGHFWEGVAILAAGMLIISMIDNLLRPLLLGKDVQMHPLLIFLSTLGGIILFGISGFVIGPIITALMLAILEMHETYYQDKKEKAGT